MSKGQRQEILAAAWPNIPKFHRPDINMYAMGTLENFRNADDIRDAYLWPYINLEDLLGPKSLPLLLNTRARHTPDTFANADFTNAHIGRRICIRRAENISGYTVVFKGRYTPDNYGEIVS